MSSAPLSETAKKNIEAIAQVEQQLHERRSRVEKIGDPPRNIRTSPTLLPLAVPSN